MSDPLVGKTLPSLTLSHSDGGKVTLPDDFKGQWTILYFYPKDDTPGCTKQACSYRDNIAQFKEAGAEVWGVSLDDLASHDDFREKYTLNFPLIADTEHKLSETLGVYGDQEWQGKTFKGLSRDTFLIDPDGAVRQVWRKVNPLETVSQTYEALKSHQS